MFLRHSTAAVLGCLAVMGVAASVARAQNVTTDPVGAITITLKGSSDTNVSLPFHRPVALETQVQSMTGNVISISASANITASQFVYVKNSQPNTYYVQFTTGGRAGMYYTVTANDQTSITIDNNGDSNLSNVVGSGNTFRVIPYWTLNTLFPSGQGINQSSSPSANQRNSSILFMPNNVPGVASTTSGINLVSAVSFYYYNGSAGTPPNNGPGWRKASDNTFAILNDTIIYPDTFFTVHNAIPGDTTLTVVGAVPMSAYTTPITVLAANKPQDIFVGINAPVPVSLSASNLSTSGAFLASSSPAANQRNDTLLVFNTGLTGFNHVPANTYYYYSGAAGTPPNNGPGWRLAGDNSFTIQDNLVFFQPGQAYIIRKKAVSSPQTFIWSFTPSYLGP